MLPENHKRSDSIALTKAGAYRCVEALGRRACPLRLLRSHLSQGERLWHRAAMPERLSPQRLTVRFSFVQPLSLLRRQLPL